MLMVTVVCHPLFVPYSFVRQSHILFIVSENDGHIGLWIRTAGFGGFWHGPIGPWTADGLLQYQYPTLQSVMLLFWS